MDTPNVGIVADWLVTYGGAERVVKEFSHLYPQAELYSVVDYLSNDVREIFRGKQSNTTFIQHLPFSKCRYQNYLPLMPLAIEQLDVSRHDVILSSSHAVAKGILTGPDQLHISYVHSPMRYAWDMQHQYLRDAGLEGGLKGIITRYLLHRLRVWDYRTANGVDHFIANSKFIARRIKKTYGRDADVIYPPVDIEKFTFSEQKENYYLTASRLVPYKRVDLIVEAFGHMPDKKLVVIGNGSELRRIKSIAGRNVEIIGYQPDDILQKYMQNARAFIFAAEEDFGIAPVEAQACGTPVIAFGKGGALESVRQYGYDEPTGLFFYTQDIASVIDAVRYFESVSEYILPKDCRANAENFSIERFRREIQYYTSDKWMQFQSSRKVNFPRHY